jgi:hypothetical protein
MREDEVRMWLRPDRASEILDRGGYIHAIAWIMFRPREDVRLVFVQFVSSAGDIVRGQLNVESGDLGWEYPEDAAAADRYGVWIDQFLEWYFQRLRAGVYTVTV